LTPEGIKSAGTESLYADEVAVKGGCVAPMADKRARFDAQVLPHLDAAHRLARWLASSPADAEDVVQEAMLRAYRGFDSLRGSDAKAWLMVIVRNCHYSAAKQRQRHSTLPLPEEDDSERSQALVSQSPGPENIATLRDEARVWVRLLEQLPEEQRVVLMLREVEEMSYAQIAVVMSAPIGTVMSRLARARLALRASWLKDSEEISRAVR
jgi:RNA polymerase sigma factor (sigma-70 family)